MGGLRMSYEEFIHDRGRGPEIKGTRITVYSIIDYLLSGERCDWIAAFLGLSSQEVQAAIDYIADHKAEVIASYAEILERCAKGNPPELQAKLDAGHEKFLALVKQIREVKDRSEAEIKELIKRHRASGAEEHAHAGDHGR
jgi:uncharacterized protein (DUF433 family)